MKNGDILLFRDGDMCQVIDLDWHGGRTMIIRVDEDEQHSYDTYVLENAENLGQSPGILATFYSARSIHKRLNKLGKV